MLLKASWSFVKHFSLSPKRFSFSYSKDFKLDDNEDWVASFCSSGLTVDEIYSVLGASNIRELRDGNLENLLKLIAKVLCFSLILVD